MPVTQVLVRFFWSVDVLAPIQRINDPALCIPFVSLCCAFEGKRILTEIRRWIGEKGLCIPFFIPRTRKTGQNGPFGSLGSMGSRKRSLCSPDGSKWGQNSKQISSQVPLTTQPPFHLFDSIGHSADLNGSETFSKLALQIMRSKTN